MIFVLCPIRARGRALCVRARENSKNAVDVK